MPSVALARLAMATRFEIVLHGESPFRLRAAGEEALNEVDRLERRLSLYRPESEVAQVNARAALEPVRVSPEVFALLQRAKTLSAETAGAFDITLAPLLRCWGFMGERGNLPGQADLDRCRDRIGMRLVELDAASGTVRFHRDGVMLDLGAIGKGYAVDQAADLLREAGVESALIHGGTSTVYALGQPPDAPSWTIAIETHLETGSGAKPPGQNPGDTPEVFAAGRLPAIPKTPSRDFKIVGPSPEPPESALKAPLLIKLRDEALSVSAARGKFFEADGRVFGHVLDPRTGWPAAGTALAAVALPSATESDALSTALLVLGGPGQDQIGALRTGMKTAVLVESGAEWRLQTRNLGGAVAGPGRGF